MVFWEIIYLSFLMVLAILGPGFGGIWMDDRICEECHDLFQAPVLVDGAYQLEELGVMDDFKEGVSGSGVEIENWLDRRGPIHVDRDSGAGW